MVTTSNSLPVACAADVHRMYTGFRAAGAVPLPRIPVWNFQRTQEVRSRWRLNRS